MSDPLIQGKKRRLNNTSQSENSGDDGKKRGRPRVDKQDESAADRRRTQIRKAQRAYRQRKESTLEELRKRVTDLSNTMELMNKAFVDCADRLASSGLSADQAAHIRDVEMKYEELMKCVRNPEDEHSPELDESVHRASISSRPRTQISNDLEPKNVPSWMDEAVLESSMTEYAARDDVGMGYTMYLDTPPSDQTRASVSSARRTPPRSNNTYTTFRVETQIPATLPLPRTYSFQETTFARRLHRATLESGYQLALDPSKRLDSFNRAFKLCLLTYGRDSLAATMKTLLDRGPDDGLDSSIPMVHIGGAGTHYRRRDKFGVLLPKKQTENLGVIGPQALALLERSVRENMMTDLTVEVAGFEGEWFDPYDVEGYLAEKGIFIDPLSSFAEADVDIMSPPPTQSSSTSSSGQTMSPELQHSMRTTPDDPSAPYLQEQLESLGTYDPTPGEWAVGFSDASTGSWMNFLSPGEGMKQRLLDNMQWGSASSPYMSNDLPAEPTVTKQTLVIDVSKFIQVLTSSGSCLGKSPGFRRKDVDRALELSSFNPF